MRGRGRKARPAANKKAVVKGQKRVRSSPKDDDPEVSFNLPPQAKRARIEDETAVEVADEEPAAPRKSPNGFILPDPLPRGHVVQDTRGQRWRLGRAIGLGGFGEIYAAAKEFHKAEEYVVKVEPHHNGPLFVEVAFYLNAGRKEQMEEWKSQRGHDHLGLAHYVASGSTFTASGKKLRFLVLPRLGTDLQSVVDAAGGEARAFTVKTVCALASQVLDSLEYIHHAGYIHKDVKGSNILFQRGGRGDRVTLIDFGLCSKYAPGGLHKPYSVDRRWAHEGTVEYASRDGHSGCFTRRGDLEVLLYNVIEWLGGRLPWENWQDVKPSAVHAEKIKAYRNIEQFLASCFSGRGVKAPAFLSQAMHCVAALAHDQEPEYRALKSLLCSGTEASTGKQDSSCSEDDEVTLNLSLASVNQHLSSAGEEKENEDPQIPGHRKRPGLARGQGDEEPASEDQPPSVCAAYDLTRLADQRRRDELSMLNPTPAMVKQATAMRQREEAAAALSRPGSPGFGGSAQKHKRVQAQ